MLDVLLSEQVKPEKKKDILQSEFNIAMTKTMEREAMEMCNLSQGIVDRVTIRYIMNMMEGLNLSEKECMRVLKVPKEQQALYHMMLQEKKPAVSQV